MKIGIFDSGVGGLTVLKKIVELMPEYEYVYLADTARAPYGDRSQDRIIEFTRQGVSYLMTEKKCALVILACNTASAFALRNLQQEWLPAHFPGRRILGVIIPTVEYIAEKKLSDPIAIIGTRGTIASRVYEKEIEKRVSPMPRLVQQPCPLLVPLIEEGWHATTPARMIIKKYLRPLKDKQAKTLVLGCTHYPIVLSIVKQIMGNKVRIIDPGHIVAESLKAYLVRHGELEKKLSKKSTIFWLSTDVSQRTREVFHRFWKVAQDIRPVSLE